MFEFLENFEKRMQWIGAADSILNRKGKNTAIEDMFYGNDMTNIIISVLLFIMEKTLEENNECEMMHIEDFLSELLKTYYSKQIAKQQVHVIADYIVKGILQNNGVSYTYSAKNYTKNTTEEVSIRLISDKIVEDNDGRKIVYMLTDQGYNFLFRLREVDEEIQLTMEQLKLKEYIKRKKFTSAVRQSVELISYVRQKIRDIENFVLRLRQNIENVDVAQYEELIKSTYTMLAEEYETMEDIQRMVNQAEDKLNDETANGDNIINDKLLKAVADIQEIQHNIGVVISEQRDLISDRHSLGELYLDTIKKSFEYSFEKRYDFEEVVLNNLEQYSGDPNGVLKIIRPLFLPRYNKHLSIASIYEPQMILKGAEKEDNLLIAIDEYDDSKEVERVSIISERYVKTINLIIEEVLEHGETALSNIIASIKEKNANLYESLKQDRCLFTTAIKLYDLGSVHIQDFFLNQSKVLMMPSEEFNIEYCLNCLRDSIIGIEDIKELNIEKADGIINETFAYEADGMKITENIQMSDLLFKAVM